MLRKLRKIFLDGHIVTEVQVIIKRIGICKPMAVEITQCKPIWLKNLFGRIQADCPQEINFELIICDAVFRTATDVVKTFSKKLSGTSSPHTFASSRPESSIVAHSSTPLIGT